MWRFQASRPDSDSYARSFAHRPGPSPLMEIRSATVGDVPAILDIVNHYVANTDIIFDTEPRSLEAQQQWLADHNSPMHPVLVGVEDGDVVGWASLSRVSGKGAYDATVEVSVYLAAAERGRGLGPQLLETILTAGDRAGVHAVVARITGGNDTSVKMFERSGFIYAGLELETGWKFGRFLDVVVMQRLYPDNVPGRK